MTSERKPRLRTYRRRAGAAEPVLCLARTDGIAYMGKCHTLVCEKWEGHSGSHVSEEGAMWVDSIGADR